MMVAIEKRRRAAELLLQFYKGRITNDDMVNEWPSDKRDPALCQVEWGVWGLYSDNYTHPIDPETQRHYRTGKLIHCCVSFLLSDCEYEWSGFPWGRFAWIAEKVSRERRQTTRKGDKSVWPFYRKQDYKRAVAQGHK